MEYQSIDEKVFEEKDLDRFGAFQSLDEIIVYYMDERSHKVDVNELAARTGISTRTINQMRSPTECQHRFSIKILVAVAIGLHMMSEHSLYMIYLNGQILRKTDKVEKYYIYLLTECNQYCVAACNDFLIEHNLAPLTEKEILSYA